MTWSIIARDESGRFGVAIASRFFSVGALCVHTKAGVAAVVTQALMNPLYGSKGLVMLAKALPADQVISALISEDKGQEQRQLHVLPAVGPGAAHTGSACVDWCGHLVYEDCSVAGNMLAGPLVLEATAIAFFADPGLPLAERLIAAMQAGQAAGGDKRGKQSAALRIQGSQDYPELDIRVDDHLEPLDELQRLYEKSLERFQPFIACLATAANPSGEIDRARIEAHIASFHASRQNENHSGTA